MGFGDVLSLSITGIIVVLLALLVLSFIVALFKLIGPKSATPVEPKKNEPPQPSAEEINKSLFFDASQLDENQMAAVFTAIAIELKLYHEVQPQELTFDYEPKTINGWSMTALSKD